MTEVSLSSVFPSLEAKAARLNKVSDDANHAIADIEKRIRELNLGLEVWHDKPIEREISEGDFSPHETSSRIARYLGFARIGGECCFAVKAIRYVSGFYEGDMSAPFENSYADGAPVPLLKSSRGLRIAALQAMPTFLQEVNEHVAAAINEIETTTSKLR